MVCEYYPGSVQTLLDYGEHRSDGEILRRKTNQHIFGHMYLVVAGLGNWKK
jgi:hypothetical protein